ncbi:MAG: cell division protein FtsQ/DivIB [Rhodobiaceae bacterium]|nr:cell division protein FtsQ/DivIB [Rhodobiaceae bacterium]
MPHRYDAEDGPAGRGLVPAASEAFERIAGRPPAYFRRKGRIFWTHWRRPILWTLAGTVVFVIGFSDLGQPLRTAAVDGVRDAALASGLRVSSIVIEGDEGIPDIDVIEAIAPFDKTPLPFFDVADARKRIMAIPRVRTATVLKLYPDTLRLTIEEREPFALWQRDGDVSVIDQDGRIVRDKPDDEQRALPLFVGEGANVSAHGLETALDAAPAVRARVVAAVRVADRRWTLKLDNGVDILLPETNTERAIGALATMLKQPNFFDQPIRAIDLRLADRVTLTLTEEGAIARRALMERRRNGVRERQT